MVSSALEARSAVRFPCWIRLALGAVVVAASAAGCSRSAQSHLERGNAHLEKGYVDAAPDCKLESGSLVVAQQGTGAAVGPHFLAEVRLRGTHGDGRRSRSQRVHERLRDVEMGTRRMSLSGLTKAEGQPTAQRTYKIPQCDSGAAGLRLSAGLCPQRPC